MPRVDFFPSLFPSCWLCLQCSTFSITSCGLCTGNYWSIDGHILIYRKMCFPKMQQYLQSHKLPQNLPVSPKVPSPWGWANFCDCLHGKSSPKWHCIVSEVRVAVYLLLVSLLGHLPWKPVHHVVRKHRPHGERCQVSGVGVLALAKLLTWPRVGINHQKREWRGLAGDSRCQGAFNASLQVFSWGPRCYGAERKHLCSAFYSSSWPSTLLSEQFSQRQTWICFSSS